MFQGRKPPNKRLHLAPLARMIGGGHTRFAASRLAKVASTQSRRG